MMLDTLVTALDLGAHNYGVSYEAPSGEYENALGTIDEDRLQILVAPHLGWSKTLEVLLHELGHIWIKTLPLDDDMDERCVTAFSSGMAELLIRNPAFAQMVVVNQAPHAGNTWTSDVKLTPEG